MKGVWHLWVPVKSMLCKKCGKELTQDAKFCLYCGEPVMPEEEKPQQVEGPKKKNGKAKFWLIGAASVLFVAGVLIAIFFADIVAWGERLILSPEMLMKKAIASVAQDAGIGTMGSGFSLETPRRYRVGLYVDEEIRELLSATEEGDSAWILDLNLQILTGKVDVLRKAEMSLLIKDEPLVSLDVIQNTEKAWVGLPGLSKRYLEVSKGSLNGGQSTELTDELYSAGEITQMLRTYGAILFDSIHRVTKKNATLNVDGIRQDVLQLTATILRSDSQQALFKMANKLKEDETARKLLNDGSQKDIHAEVVNWLEEMAESADLELQLIAYLDNHNKLIGLELLGGDGETLFYWAKTVSNGKFASRLVCGSATLSGSGTCADGKETGKCRLSIDGKTVLTYKLKNFSVNKNGFTGSLIFPISAPNLPSTEMSLELSQKAVSGGDVLSLDLVVGQRPLVGLRFTAENAKDFSADIPTEVVPASDNEMVEKWVQTLDWSTLLQRLTAVGMPVNALGSLTE